MKITLLLAALAPGLVLAAAQPDAAARDPVPVVVAACKTCTVAPGPAKRRAATPRRGKRTWVVADAAESTPGWHHATDEQAVRALQVELLRNVGKQTQAADYPEDARRWSWSGTTLVHVLMGADGSLKDVSVHKTSGFRVLDDQALKMVQRVSSTRVPDRLKGRDIAVTLPIGFYFGAR
jgi:TonB family protein